MRPIPNVIRISNEAGHTQADRPITISRFFAPGEVAHVAVAQVEGVPVPTQCDVKTRWADGSLQHALLTFRVTLPAKGTVQVEFVPQDQSAPGSPLSAEAMLGNDYDFGAQLTLAGSDGKQSVDAREMLKAGKFRYWLQGPLCTQVIIEDVSDDPAHDLTFNGARSFHPIFVATFYPGTRSVKVEFIGESSWFTRLQDLTYSMALRTGNPLHDAADEEFSSFTQLARSRWRRTLWSGSALGAINVDHNLPYLIYSQALPNFDLSKQVPGSSLNSVFDLYKKNASKTGQECGKPFGACMLQKDFGSTGGRMEIGLYPTWAVYYLYTFDSQLLQVMLDNAEAGAHAPIHVRESASGLAYHRSAEKSADAQGHPVSIDARPCFVSRDNGDLSCKENRVTFVKPPLGARDPLNGWIPDLAHQADLNSIPYLITGDWYWLEEMYAWAAWNVSYANYGNEVSWTRGGTGGSDGSWGYIYPSTNVRGYAWGLRNLANAAVMAPDTSPEKGYFLEKLVNNIVIHEGRFDIRDGISASDSARQPMWQFGRKVMGWDAENPLMFWEYPGGRNVSETDDATFKGSTFYHSSAPWMANFCFIVLGRMEELGVPSKPLRQRTMTLLLHQLQDPNFNPYQADAYQLPDSTAKGVFMKDWKTVLAAFSDAEQQRKSWVPSRVGDPDGGYGFIAVGAASYLTDLSVDGLSGMEAWRWLRGHYPHSNGFSTNPKWDLVPRNVPSPGSVSDPRTWSHAYQRWEKRAALARR